MMKLDRLILERAEHSQIALWKPQIFAASNVFGDRRVMLQTLYKALMNNIERINDVISTENFEKEKFVENRKIFIENRDSYIEVIVKCVRWNWSEDDNWYDRKNPWSYTKDEIDTKVRLYPRPNGWMVLIQHEETRADKQDITDYVSNKSISHNQMIKIEKFNRENKDHGGSLDKEGFNDVMMWYAMKQNWNKPDEIKIMGSFTILQEDSSIVNFDVQHGSLIGFTFKTYIPAVLQEVFNTMMTSGHAKTNYFFYMKEDFIKNFNYKEVSKSEIELAEEVLNYKWVHHEAKKKDPNAPDFLADFGY